jgi:hypothetical protein
MIALILLLAEPVTPIPLPSFLAGCWLEQKGEAWTEECWTVPKGGQMMGSGRTGKGDTVGHWEFMRIERGPEGVLSFHGSPKGAPAVAFTATQADANAITFVNADHDYPQRVRYVRTTAGIDAEISMADGSKPNRWTYRRPGAPIVK